MSDKRRDNKGRILKTGESQRKDGRYAFKYTDALGNPQFLYSWKLVPTDKMPAGKRNDVSLREKEKEVIRDLDDGIDPVGKKLTVCELYERHNGLREKVEDSTVIGRERLIRWLSADKLGHMAIDKVRPIDAQEWVIRMKAQGRAYKTIKNDKRSLFAAFRTAIENDYVRKNPFDFKITDFIEDDSDDKIPLTPEQQASLIDWMAHDSVYCKYVDDVILLLETGLRISEMCGLTIPDLWFEAGLINIDHQLLYNTKKGYYIAPPKTDAGFREVPMSPKAEAALKRIIARGKKSVITVDGRSEFIFLTPDNKPMTRANYVKMFEKLVKKYNKCHENKLPENTTAHTMRHTFCTDMANAGMNPKTLQYIMGHANIQMTLQYYAHATSASAKTEFDRIAEQRIYYSCTTSQSENIKTYNGICEVLPNEEKPQTLVKPSFATI